MPGAAGSSKFELLHFTFVCLKTFPKVLIGKAEGGMGENEILDQHSADQERSWLLVLP